MADYLIAFAERQIAHSSEPLWRLREYLRACLALWRKDYGDEVADKAAAAIESKLKERA